MEERESSNSEVDQPLDPALRRLIWILVLGVLAPGLDSTIVDVAPATLGRDLHTSVASSQWTVTGYLLAAAITMPVTGWANERFGGKRMWVCSLAVFLAGSVLARGTSRRVRESSISGSIPTARSTRSKSA